MGVGDEECEDVHRKSEENRSHGFHETNWFVCWKVHVCSHNLETTRRASFLCILV